MHGIGTSSSSSTQKNKKVFHDVSCSSLSIGSQWQDDRTHRSKKSVQCQTSPELYNFQEREVQSGRYTRIIQDQILPEDKDRSLLEHFCIKHTKLFNPKAGPLNDVWRNKIADGFVTVDCEVATDPMMPMEADLFLEFVDHKAHASCQTEAPTLRKEIFVDATADSKGESKSESKTESKSARSSSVPASLLIFLQKVTPLVLQTLEANEKSTAFDSLPEFSAINEDAGNEVYSASAWRTLTVDLEKKKVVFPDWTKARHFGGVVLKCVLTRNKERVYDIEYEDGVKFFGVREEYIRLLDESSAGKGKKGSNVDSKRNSGNAIAARLLEGVRVHAKVMNKSGVTKYVPGRIVRVSRNTYDVECEGSKVETGLTVDDLIIGLSEGQRIEARKPQKVTLQCTGNSWNSTGNTIAASYGKNDIQGWCNFPGALCVWNLFSKSFDANNPDVVLDHQACLMSVCFHPVIPSIVAAGSFNGEILVWDLSAADTLVAVSPIIEYSHKDPVVELRWVYNGADDWLLLSIGADGKVLFWSLINKLQHPVKGFSISKGKGGRRAAQQCHGASALTLSTSMHATRQAKAKWMIIGQEGGSMIRCQMSRLTSPAINAEMLKSMPAMDEVFPPLKKSDDLFNHQHHIGAVTCLDWSPFNRNLFLSAGCDGVVKLFHVLDQTPLKKWEPSALRHNSSGATHTSGMTSISAVKFSAMRPMVFAVATTDGFVFIYDLKENMLLPVVTLHASQSAASTEEDKKRGLSSSKSGEIPLTSLAFNHKQRDLIAACDWLGRVHIWKLSWKLSNRQRDEQQLLDDLGKLASSEENENTV